MRLRAYLAAAIVLVATSLAAISPSFAQSKPDSTQATAVGALPPSNCPNIQTQWYAAGVVPSGYYKQANPPYSCLPIPACAGNQVFSTGSESCGCPAGTTWNSGYNTCHTPCAGGTAWNGSSCANICPGGTSWNGSSCASICSAGTAWNGTTCASVCTGGQTWNGSSCSCPAGGNWNGSSCVTCGAGTSWNGSTCASICTGGQNWNGSACACPAGQAWNGSSCGVAPSIGGFSVSPAAQNVGTNYTVSWSTSGTSVSSTIQCSGAISANNSLVPATGGTAALANTAPGATSCVLTASNAWGSATAGAAVTSACPPGTAWNGTSCAVAATTCPAMAMTNGWNTGSTLSNLNLITGNTYAQGWYQGSPQIYSSMAGGNTGQTVNRSVTSGWCAANPATNPCNMITYNVPMTCQANGTWAVTCPGNTYWDAAAGYCQPPRVYTVRGLNWVRSSMPQVRVTAITPTRIRVEGLNDSGSAATMGCTLTSPGQMCHMVNSGTQTTADGYTGYDLVTNWMRASPFGYKSTLMSARLNTDGTIGVWTNSRGAAMDFYQCNAACHDMWNWGAVPSNWQTQPPGTQATITMSTAEGS